MKPNEAIQMSPPRVLILFEGIEGLSIDCTNEIVGHLDKFDRMSLSRTNKDFRQLVGNFNKKKMIPKLINNINGIKLFDGLLTLPADMDFVKELWALSEMSLSKLTFYSSKFYITNDEYLDLIDWLNSDEAMQSNSLALWSIGFAIMLHNLWLSALPYQLNVTEQNLLFMKMVVKETQPIYWMDIKPRAFKQTEGKQDNLTKFLGYIIQLHENGSEENKEIKQCIVEKLFHRFYPEIIIHLQIDTDANVNTRSAFINATRRFYFLGKEQAEPCRDFYRKNAEFFRENELPSEPFDRFGNHPGHKVWPHSKWLLAGKLMISVSSHFNDKWMLKKFSSHVMANFLTYQTLDQVEKLKGLIESSHVEVNVIHKCFLMLHLMYNKFNFRKYEKTYRDYLASLVRLNAHIDLNEKVLNVLNDFFNETYWDHHPEFRQYFLNTILHKRPWSENFWNAVYDASLYNEAIDEDDRDEKEMEKEFVSFRVAMFDENENYNDRAALDLVSYVYYSIYDEVINIGALNIYFDACAGERGRYCKAINTGRVGSFADFRQMLSIKLDNKLWLIDEKNQDWLDTRSPMRHCFLASEDDNEGATNYKHFFVCMLETMCFYPSAPIRLNQLLAFDDVLLMTDESIKGFNSHAFIAMLRLPDNLFDIALGKLEKLRREKSDTDIELLFLQPFIKLLDSTDYFVKGERGALVPFYDFLGRLNKEALSVAMSELASKSILSIMLEYYLNISNYNGRLADLYLRLVEHIFTLPDKPVDEFKSLVALGERCNGFKPATPATRWFTDTSNAGLIYWEFTKQIEGILSDSIVCRRGSESNVELRAAH